MSEHFAFVDDVGVIANAQCFTNVVVGDQHTDAAVFQKTHDALNFDHGDRVDAGKRFVKKNEARVSRQGSGDFRTTSLAARKRQSCIGADVLNLKFIKQIVESLFDLSARQTSACFVVLQFQNGADVVFNGQFAKDACFLRKVGHAEPSAFEDRQVRNRLVV